MPRRILTFLAPYLTFFILPTLLLWQVLWGQNTLIPFDNLYQGLPWYPFREQVGVGNPHNELVSDLVLENFQWKTFAIEQYRQGKLPLWQPNQFAGSPFLAAGQHSMLYPLALLYLILPIHAAYGWFAHLSLVLAGITMFAFARTVGLSRSAALIAGLTYQGCGFLTISMVFPMMVAGAAWLPLLLAALYKLREAPRANAFVALVLGSGAIAGAVLAGHVEILYYTLLVGGLYGLWSLVTLLRQPKVALTFAGMGLGIALIGVMLGGAQLIPLYEVVSQNWREGSSSIDEVRGYAWAPRQAATLLLPDFLGDPSRHTFYNLTNRQWEPIITQQPIDAAGGTLSLDHVAWFKGAGDWKNYVEGAGYLGIFPLILSGIALIGLWRTPSLHHLRSLALFAVILSGLSVLFIFGTPLYGVLFYTLPGWSQLHTPFRWIFPLSICISLFAGIGWHLLDWRVARPRATHEISPGTSEGVRGLTPLQSRVRFVPGIIPLVLGTLGLAILTIIYIAPDWWVAQAAKLLDRSQLTQYAFGGSAALFLSYQWANFLHLGLALLGSGIALLLGAQAKTRRFALPVAAIVLIADLTAAAWGFMPATPVSVAEFTPPSIQWLQEQHTPGAWRYTALEKDWKVFNANMGWEYGLEDIRGYDSIIYKPYVDYMRETSPQNQLDFNRIAPLRAETPPNQTALDHLNVRYLVTDQPLEWEGWQLAYDQEVKIYENLDVLPRAYLIGNATGWGQSAGENSAEPNPDPRALLLLGGKNELTSEPPLRSDLPFTPVEITSYNPDEITMRINPDQGAWLVLNEVDFPGWRVFTKPIGAENESEQEIQLADGLYRAVWAEAGEQEVRWRYSPNSIRVGFFVSFLGVAFLMLSGAVWLWGKVYQPQADEGNARRVARNSFAPMVLQLFNKGVDTVFAAFMARLLGAETLGQYAFAVTIIGTFITITNFGLGTLLTRDVARDPSATNRLFNATLRLRVGLYAIAFPILVGGLLLWSAYDSATLEPITVWTIVLLAVGLIPSNLADAITAVFRAYEKFEIPALIATIATFIKVTIGAAVLLAGWSLIGLAATSLITNMVTLVLLAWLVGRTIYRPKLQAENLPLGAMLKDAFPLMINEFLATAFFRIDQILLKPQRGNAEAGYYNVAYKFIDGLLILPSAFTLAIFPVMSRYAQGQPDSLLRATTLSLRWLVMIALPIALLTTRYADGIVLAFGGPEFLPESSIALQLLIWFLPFSFVNSLVQYVLIAAGQQHQLTRAYLVALFFNIIANLIAIRFFGLYGAAIVTVLSEIALLIPFYVLMRRSVGGLPWLDLFVKPTIALLVATLPLYLIPLPFWLAIPASGTLYLVALILLRTFNEADRLLIAKFIPARWRDRFAT
jgi:O-antigen/teichoic acid export membrane protein